MSTAAFGMLSWNLLADMSYDDAFDASLALHSSSPTLLLVLTRTQGELDLLLLPAH